MRIEPGRRGSDGDKALLRARERVGDTIILMGSFEYMYCNTRYRNAYLLSYFFTRVDRMLAVDLESRPRYEAEPAIDKTSSPLGRDATISCALRFAPLRLRRARAESVEVSR